MPFKISVIVPVYNVEPYLKKCVDSILNQTFKDFELILVNDGSPDNCGMICDEYSEKDCRVRVIHKENEGVAAARNTGINSVRGEYTMFVDSDDWIEEDTLEKLINQAELLKSDVVIFGSIKDLYSNKELIKSEINAVLKKLHLNIYELGANFTYLFNSVGLLSSWMYFFKTKIITENKLFFNENLVLYEDFDFNLRFLKRCTNITFIPNILYHYNLYTSTNQLAKRNKLNIVSDIKTVIWTLFDFLEFTEKKDKIVNELFPYLLSMYTLPLKKMILHKNYMKFSEKVEVFEELRNDKTFSMIVSKYGSSLRFYKILNLLLKMKMYRLAYFLVLLKL